MLSTGHPWICKDGVAPDRPLDLAILSRMKQFTAMNKMKKIALRVKSLPTADCILSVGYPFSSSFKICQPNHIFLSSFIFVIEPCMYLCVGR